MPPLRFVRRALSRTLVCGLAAVCLAMPAGAQAPATFPTPDATLERLWRLGMDSSRVQSLAQALLDSIGPRLTGTARQKAANDWLLSLYKEWGVAGKN